MIKVALFGSEETVSFVKKFDSLIKEIEVHPFIYQTTEDMKTLIIQAANCDVYLFSGILPYYHTKKILGEFDKPAVYIADNELNVSLTILSLTHHRLAELDRISIDLPDRKNLDIIINQLEMSPKPIHVLDYSWIRSGSEKRFEIETIIEFHHELWKSGKVNFVITSIHAVHDQLVRLKVPCMRMIDAEKTIVDALKEAKSLGELQLAQHSQVAMGLIMLSSEDEEIKTAEELISKELSLLVKKINCTIQQTNNGSMTFYGTKGGIEYLINNPHLMDDVYKTANDRSVYIHIGVGLGMTIIEAKNNAQIAVSYSNKHSCENSLYIVNEDKVVINPQTTAHNHSILKTEDESIVQLAKLLKISVPNVIKMKQFINSRPVNSFTSSDISEYFSITKRSSERMLKKYMDCGFLHVIGEEQPFQNGRPRAVYRLDIININANSQN